MWWEHWRMRWGDQVKTCWFWLCSWSLGMRRWEPWWSEDCSAAACFDERNQSELFRKSELIYWKIHCALLWKFVKPRQFHKVSLCFGFQIIFFLLKPKMQVVVSPEGEKHSLLIFYPWRIHLFLKIVSSGSPFKDSDQWCCAEEPLVHLTPFKKWIGEVSRFL